MLTLSLLGTEKLACSGLKDSAHKVLLWSISLYYRQNKQFIRQYCKKSDEIGGISTEVFYAPYFKEISVEIKKKEVGLRLS